MNSLLLLSAALVTVVSAAEPLGEIAGIVVDAGTRAPLAEVIVLLQRDGPKVATGADGKFHFTHVKADDYTLICSKDGFVSEQARIGLGENDKALELELRMSREASISGHVINAKGERIEASVTLLQAALASHVASGRTKEGSFRLSGLRGGTYKLSAQASVQKQYALTYFPSEALHKEAAIISLQAGEHRPDVSVLLRESRTFTIRGRYLGEVQKGKRYMVTYSRLDKEPLGFQTTAFPRDDGGFEMQVPTGRYVLIVHSAPQDSGQPVYLGFRELIVGESGMDGIVIPASPIRSIRARFRWAATGRGDALRGGLSLNPMEGLGVLQFGKPQQDGSILVPNVTPDRYSFLVNGLPKGTYVQAILAQGVDITQRGLDLINGSSTELEIVVADNGGTVTAGVIDGSNRAVVGASVSIGRISNNQTELALSSRAIFCDAKGRFVVDGLAPGEYSARVELNGRRSTPQTFRVTAGGRVALELVLP